MSATGSAVVDFGAYPGSDTASVAVTGQTGILSGSKVEAYVDPTIAATADHSQDEHLMVDADVRCSAIVAGVGFTINMLTRGAKQYGQWNVTWVWT